MRSFSFILFFFTSFIGAGQTYQLTVQNGYGSGNYAAGDTVHIWAAEYPNTEVFWRWAGQTEAIADWNEQEDNWHKIVVMPAKNITVRALTKPMPPNSDLQYEEIRGRDTLKRVFYYFPPKYRGVVWFFHGTGGAVYAWVNAYDNRQLVNRCIADSLAVIMTECEESTKGRDLDQNGYLGRWFYTPDSVGNVDFANIRAIRDTFIHRGKMNYSTPQIGVGFSAGGAMSLIMGLYANWKIGVDYGTGGVTPAAEFSKSPSMICPNRRDDHPDVGPASVGEALAHQQQYLARGVCSEVHINEPGPLHPQRFRRKPGITAAQSLALYNDLKNNGCLGPNNYLIKSNKVIEGLVKANPQNWPGLAGLGPQELSFVQDQINVLWSAHHFTPDFDGYTLRFIRDACGKTSAVAPEPGQPLEMLKISPNPTAGRINVSIAPGEEVRIFNLTGQTVLVAYGPAIDVSVLSPGLYIVRTATGIGKLIRG